MDEEINLGEISIDEDQIQIPSINIPLIKGDKGDTGAKGDDGQDYVITSSDYQAIADIVENDITIPTKLSDLDNDEGFIDNTVNDLENYTKTSDLSSVATSGSYNDLSNTPSIPTKTSDLTNDSGFIDKNVNNLTNYTLKTNTGSLIDLEINQSNYVVSLSLKDIDGNVISSDNIDLPLESVVVGGSYDATNKKIVLTLENGNTVDIPVGDLIAGLQTEITSTNKLASDLVDDSNSGNKFTNTSEKNSWNAKYNKPSGGIPKTDLASAVQTSLNKADTALQEHQDITGKEDKTNKVTTVDENSTNTQYPSAKCVYDSQEEQNTDIENLQEENERLKATLPTTTGEGQDITLDKTAEMEFVKSPLPRGNTKQNTTTGKNLLPPLNSGSLNGLTFTTNSNGITTISGTTTSVTTYFKNVNKILPAGTYTLSINLSYTPPANSSQLILQDINNVRLATINLWKITSKTFTLSADTEIKNYYLFSNSEIQHNGTISIQLEEGSTATSYEPYTGGQPSPSPDYPQEVEVVTGNVEVTISNENNTESKTLPVSLGNIELCKLGDYQDYLYKNNGKWYKYNAINKSVFNGSENWNYNVQNNVAYLQLLTKVSSRKGLFSNLFNYYNADWTTAPDNTISEAVSSNFIFIKSTVASNISTWKSWLSTHNTIVYYVLATPTSTEITDTTLISQLEEISKTLSYQGQTNITSNTIALFDVEAYQSTELVLEEIEENYVTNTDYASYSTGGVVKVDGAFSTFITDGKLKCTSKTYGDYQNLSSYAFIGKGTLENVITGKGLIDISKVKTTTNTTQGNVYDVTYINTMIGDVETVLTTLTTGSGV